CTKDAEPAHLHIATAFYSRSSIGRGDPTGRSPRSEHRELRPGLHATSTYRYLVSPAGLDRPYAPISIPSRIGRGSSCAGCRYWATGVSERSFTEPGFAPAPR